MPFDYKKEYKNLYQPKAYPALVEIPAVSYVAVQGKGDPNTENGEYASAMGLLYGISFTIKMSHLGSRVIEGYFPYVVPPLEGLWWMQDGKPGVDYGNKAGFCWISMIRLPEFVTPEVFAWAKGEVACKKNLDVSKAALLTLEEGLCVQCMHLGPYDEEPSTVAKMDAFLKGNGYLPDFSDTRRHHEIYLGDPRRTLPERLRTVIRHPIRQIGE